MWAAVDSAGMFLLGGIKVLDLQRNRLLSSLFQV
jgi:hypothetical protein